jgi:serine/threonine protein kinase/tetratricopeptide (TPR) repeat protein
MNVDRWRRIEELFEAAVELEPDRRAELLNKECAGDTVLLKQVESLILSEQEAGSFIDQAIRDAAWRLDQHQTQPAAGQRIGTYQVVREIGRGGMGAVYLAHRADDEYQKQVAIKLVRSGVATSEVLRRFRSERQILANLDHPNIARLLDGGTTDSGTPYVVMDYVEGIPIDEYCDRNSLSIEGRIRLFRKTCAAVRYAHQNLVVHRDIKPGNILVTAEGEPKLLDFGIAKLLKSDQPFATVAETRPGIAAMTPEYASPEQVRGEAITTASDVYSLGVVLYELLAGRPPYTFNRRQPREIERAICEQEPDRPSAAVTRKQRATTDTGNDAGTRAATVGQRATTTDRLRRRLRGDLDNIVMMAMRKEPSRRYASVEQLSEDLRRHLDGLPVIARPATFRYRTLKFVRRHPVGVAAATVIFVLIAALVGFYTWRLAGERDRARLEAAKAARVSEFLTGLFQVSDPSQSKGETITAKELLERGATRIKNELAGQPEVQATMMNVIGTVYLSLGLYDRAEPLLEEALSTRRRLYGEKNSEVAGSLLSIGHLHYARGDYDGAESFCRQALEVNRELLGNESLEVARSMNLLATALHGKGDYPAAESMFRQVIELRRKRQGNQHADVLTNLSSLSTVLIDKGDHEAAESIMGEIVDLRRSLYGDRDPQLAIDINNLAAARYSRGELAGAEQLFREALALRRKVLGEEHPDVAEGLNNLAVVLRDEGRYDEAESLVGQAIAIETRNRGADHWYVAYYQSTLGLVQHARGDYEAAEATFRKALETYKKAFPDDNAYSAVPMLGLGLVLTDRGKPEKAEPLLRRCLAIFQKGMPAGHWQTALTENALGYCLGSMKRFDEAEPLLLKSFAVIRAKRGEQSRATKDCADRIVKLYDAWKKPDQAAEYRALLSK